MKTAAIALDDWKLEIFKEELDKSSYKYEEAGELTEGVLTLKVYTKNLAKLAKVVKRANVRAARSKMN